LLDPEIEIKGYLIESQQKSAMAWLKIIKAVLISAWANCFSSVSYTEQIVSQN